MHSLSLKTDHEMPSQQPGLCRQGTQPSESRAVVTRASRHHRHHSRRYTAPKEGMWDSGGTIQVRRPSPAGHYCQYWCSCKQLIAAILPCKPQSLQLNCMSRSRFIKQSSRWSRSPQRACVIRCQGSQITTKAAVCQTKLQKIEPAGQTQTGACAGNPGPPCRSKEGASASWGS